MIATLSETPRLLGREAELETLLELVDRMSERGGALVIRGEPGIGKTALLDTLWDRASACVTAHAAGVESEMEFAFAGLHQLCAPFLDRLERLAGPQRDALGTAFGLQAGDVPDRFLIGMAVLSLLADVAEERRLVCVVDDAQWLDQASAQVLGFVARRLEAEAVALIFAVREPSEASGACRSSWSKACATLTLASSCPWCCGGRWMKGCASGSWLRPVATRWRCLSCREGSRSAGRRVRITGCDAGRAVVVGPDRGELSPAARDPACQHGAPVVARGGGAESATQSCYGARQSV